MKTPLTIGHLIFIVIVVFVLYYVWVAIIPHHGKPPGTDMNHNAPGIEADHKWINGKQIY